MSENTHDVTTPTIDVTKAEPVEVSVLEPPKVMSNAKSTPASLNLLPLEPSLSGSQLLREELWKSREAGGISEDSASVASDISSVSKKTKKKTFFSFGRKKDKQKEVNRD